ncbi:MAG: hypothetical protein MK212_06895 [Saprospiraceae bacterium]|nr:hypothetical protein [Saprospiraceae bacterium]
MILEEAPIKHIVLGLLLLIVISIISLVTKSTILGLEWYLEFDWIIYEILYIGTLCSFIGLAFKYIESWLCLLVFEILLTISSLISFINDRTGIFYVVIGVIYIILYLIGIVTWNKIYASQNQKNLV